MFEEIIATLDELGVVYNEDYDAGTLTIEIADIDKETLVEVIRALNDAGETYDISDTTITLQSTEATEPVEEEEESNYMEDALNQYNA